MTETQTEEPKARPTVVRELLERNDSQLAIALNDRIPSSYFIRTALTAMQQNPGILACTDGSIMLSLLHAASLGLSPDGMLGLAYLVPYKQNREGKPPVSKCQLIIGAQGYIELAMRSGIKKIEAELVYGSDEIEVVRGTDGYVRHLPDLDAERDDATSKGVRGVYAIAWLENGEQIAEWMTTDQIQRVRRLAKTDKVWSRHWAEMARKTVIRRLAKKLPKTGDFGRAVSLENTVDETGGMPMLDDGSIEGEVLEMMEDDAAEGAAPNAVDDVREHLEERGNGRGDGPPDGDDSDGASSSSASSRPPAQGRLPDDG